jgi:hypothetical protein
VAVRARQNAVEWDATAAGYAGAFHALFLKVGRGAARDLTSAGVIQHESDNVAIGDEAIL